MSLIASFWTLEADRRVELADAFRPVQRSRTERRWLLFPQTKTETVYPWFDYMRANAKEEADFRYSGSGVADLELMLPENTSLFSLALPESADLGASAGASVALIDEPTARIALERLSAVTLRAADIVRFLETDGRPPSDPAEVESVLAAHRQMLVWCRTVTPGRIGLLMVG
jgi:hypothetical protein